MRYDLTLTNIQMQRKRGESGSSLHPHTPSHEVPSFLFVPALTLEPALSHPSLLTQQKTN